MIEVSLETLTATATWMMVTGIRYAPLTHKWAVGMSYSNLKVYNVIVLVVRDHSEIPTGKGSWFRIFDHSKRGAPLWNFAKSVCPPLRINNICVADGSLHDWELLHLHRRPVEGCKTFIWTTIKLLISTYSSEYIEMARKDHFKKVIMFVLVWSQWYSNNGHSWLLFRWMKTYRLPLSD